jgi:hypothetical protein
MTHSLGALLVLRIWTVDTSVRVNRQCTNLATCPCFIPPTFNLRDLASLTRFAGLAPFSIATLKGFSDTALCVLM